MARPAGPWLTKDDCVQCADCLEVLPITDFYLLKGSSARWNRYKRRWAKCKTCCNEYHKPYQDKYYNRPDIKFQKQQTLKRLRTEAGRCIQCTGRYKLNSAKQCKPCYIRHWLSSVWRKTRLSHWYATLTYEQQFAIAQSYQMAKSITGQSDIANKTFASHWPNEGLFQITRPGSRPELAFKLDNIAWRRKACATSQS
jgi:hypothetical protein